MRYSTAFLPGKKFAEVRKTDLQYLQGELHKSKRIIDTILEAMTDWRKAPGEDKVVISGILNMLNEPEFRIWTNLRRSWPY